MIFVDTLKWDLNTETITKKGHQPLHLLQKLRSFNVDPTLKLFYISFIDSVLIFSFICWFYNRNTKYGGVETAKWLECWTCDQKVAGLVSVPTPCYCSNM